jgi:OTU domain-containing protein 6
METLLERHAQEQKNLTSKIIGLRKSVPKSDKRKKRQVNSDIADLEYELKTRQEREIKELKGVESEDEQNEVN